MYTRQGQEVLNIKEIERTDICPRQLSLKLKQYQTHFSLKLDKQKDYSFKQMYTN